MRIQCGLDDLDEARELAQEILRQGGRPDLLVLDPPGETLETPVRNFLVIRDGYAVSIFFATGVPASLIADRLVVSMASRKGQNETVTAGR